MSHCSSPVEVQLFSVKEIRGLHKNIHVRYTCCVLALTPLRVCVCVCVSENTYGKVYMVLTDGSCVGEQHCIAAMGCCHFKWCKGAERKVVTSMCVCVLCVFCVWELSGSLPPVRSLQAQKHHICEVVQGQHKDWDQERCSSCVYVCVCMCVYVCVCVHSSLSF